MTTDYQFQSLPASALDDAQIVFLPIAYDDTVSGSSGTADGPRGIFEVSDQLELYEEDLRWSPFQHLNYHVRPELRREDGESEEAFHTRITEAAKAMGEPSATRFPIALGGEHSVTPSVTAGCLTSPTTIVILDAHADLRSTYQGSVYSHACAAYHMREQGHHIIMIGIRSLTDFEAERIDNDEAISVYWPRDIRKEESYRQMLADLAALQGDVWLSVDMDGFDPSEVPGTGTPQPDGLRWYMAIDILRALFENREANIRGMDVVELIPEDNLVSQTVAAKLIHKAISFWGKRHGYDEKPKTGAQAKIAAQ